MNYSSFKKISLPILAMLLLGMTFSMSFAQSTSTNASTELPPKRGQAVYLEAFGAGLSYSFNYDTRFGNQADGAGIRVGLSAIAVDGFGLYTLPIQFNYLLGAEGSSNFFEIGIGGTYVGLNDGSDFFLTDSNGFVGTMTFAYRLQPREGFMFRAGFTPVFNLSSGEEVNFFIPYYAGVSLGYGF